MSCFLKDTEPKDPATFMDVQSPSRQRVFPVHVLHSNQVCGCYFAFEAIGKYGFILAKMCPFSIQQTQNNISFSLSDLTLNTYSAPWPFPSPRGGKTSGSPMFTSYLLTLSVCCYVRRFDYSIANNFLSGIDIDANSETESHPSSCTP